MRLLKSSLRPTALANGLSCGASARRNIPACIIGSTVHGNGLVSRRHAVRTGQRGCAGSPQSRRTLVTLAIETSCDDTCVAVLERHPSGGATLHFNAKVTSDSRQFGGVHPAVAIAGHTQHLGPLIRKAVAHLPWPRAKPDFVTVTRGPGMAQNLAAGLNTAKGLALAWDVPLLGVNHMQAHALTPRLVTALAAGASNQYHPSPVFPFLSLLVSGGHTMLVLSESLTAHRILVPNLSGLALGDMLDKAARQLVPQEILDALPNTMYAAALEPFAFPSPGPPPPYQPPRTRRDEIAPLPVLSPSGDVIATLTPPLSTSRRLAYDFAGLGAQVSRLVADNGSASGLPLDSRRALAAATMRLAFEHLATRVLLCLAGDAGHAVSAQLADVRTLVVSGGVARNRFLGRVLRGMLGGRGYGEDRMRIVAPPPELCTDNAAMIAWTGVEMWEAGWATGLDVMALRKWPVDPDVEGGILGVDGWTRRDGLGEFV